MPLGTVRPPAVANSFYSGNPATLRTQIKDYLELVPASQAVPKAIIAPHAGYMYSGLVAASAYKTLSLAKNRIQRVVLLGPAHRVRTSGLVAPTADFFQTPLGTIPIEQPTLVALEQQFESVQFSDAAHHAEHSLEVHLPFLQEILEDFALIPLVVGNAKASEVAAVLEKLWGGKETLIIISSDLSHYHDYDTAQRLDLETAKSIEQFQGDRLSYESACGRNPIKGLLAIAPKYRLQIQRVSLQNSGDTAGNKDQVVGYGAWIFMES